MMDLILFCSVAAIFAILGDLYLCWQDKKYEADLAGADAKQKPSAAEADVSEAAAQTAVEAVEAGAEDPAKEAAKTVEAAGKETVEAVEAAAKETVDAIETEAEEADAAETAAKLEKAEAADSPAAVEEKKEPDQAAPAKKEEVKLRGWNIPLKTMRIIAAVLALPAAAALAYYSYHMAHESNPRELVYVLKLLVSFELLIPIGLLDAKYMKIPNKIILAGLALFVAFFLVDWLVLQENIVLLLKSVLYGLLLGGGVFLVTGLIAKTGLGGGDIKLFALLGMMLTWRGVFNIIFFSLLLVVVYALFMLATKKAKKDTKIPMGPFTALAMIIIILLGI